MVGSAHTTAGPSWRATAITRFSSQLQTMLSLWL